MRLRAVLSLPRMDQIGMPGACTMLIRIPTGEGGSRAWMDGTATVATVETAMSYGPVTYREYAELPLVATLSEQWDRLLHSTTCNRAFSSAAWFLSACKADSSFSPCVITARR